MISKKLFHKANLFLKSLFVVIFFYYTPVYAYFDPVTTTTILQGLVALIAAVIINIKNPKKIIVDLRNLFVKKKKDEERDKNENNK